MSESCSGSLNTGTFFRILRCFERALSRRSGRRHKSLLHVPDVPVVRSPPQELAIKSEDPSRD